jgi:diketogulonate reductase-like aldo/keto reductase
MPLKSHAPDFIYGTAWKEERTERLVLEALESGFRAIDTANQRRHYHEEGAGRGILKFLEKSQLERKDLFIQTKFTFSQGQDHRKPYDESAPCADQVMQSFASSLQHLGTDYVDSYLLHGPYGGAGLLEPDREVWGAMSELKKQGKAKAIGVSNVNLGQLKALVGDFEVKPSFVQNRCFARTGWDFGVREFCSEKGIHYQGFSLLTANARELNSEEMRSIAEKHRRTIPQIVFQFCRQIGILPLTGTSSREHMVQDLDLSGFSLTESELRLIEEIGA